MKNIAGSIVTILLCIGIIVLSFFYMIPKIKNNSTGLTNFVDKTNGWIKTNWIWVIVIILMVMLTFIIVYIALSQKGKI